MNDWRRRAACRDLGTDLFFPVGRTGAALERDIARAVKVCNGCPVQADCATERPVTAAGVWAGVFYFDNGKAFTPPAGVVMARPKPDPPPPGSVAELMAAMTGDSNPYRHKAGTP